ncbi:MAG: hypothetical protein PVH88_19505, partial [Ignavibacteria bacterium]
SDFNYKSYRLIGTFNTKTFYDELFIAPYLQLTLDAGIVIGEYGPQHIIVPNSALGFYSPVGVFKGLKPYEFLGTEMVAVQLEHNWRTVIFQSLGLDFLSDLHIDLIMGGSFLEIRNNSDYLSPSPIDNSYWETYIGISRILALLRVDFIYNSQQEFSVTTGIGVIL